MHHVLYMIKCMSAIHFLGLYLGDFGYMLEAYLRGYGTWFEACHECFDTCSRNILVHIYGTWFEVYHGCFGTCLRHILAHELMHIMVILGMLFGGYSWLY
jgi:hypothetical protein